MGIYTLSIPSTLPMHACTHTAFQLNAMRTSCHFNLVIITFLQGGCASSCSFSPFVIFLQYLVIKASELNGFRLTCRSSREPFRLLFSVGIVPSTFSKDTFAIPKFPLKWVVLTEEGN